MEQGFLLETVPNATSGPQPELPPPLPQGEEGVVCASLQGIAAFLPPKRTGWGDFLEEGTMVPEKPDSRHFLQGKVHP